MGLTIILIDLAISFVLAISYIRNNLKTENVLIGDFDFYEEKPHLLDYVWWLFPASLVIMAVFYVAIILFKRN